MDDLNHDDIQDDNNQHNLPKNEPIIINRTRIQLFSLLEMDLAVLEFQLM